MLFVLVENYVADEGFTTLVTSFPKQLFSSLQHNYPYFICKKLWNTYNKNHLPNPHMNCLYMLLKGKLNFPYASWKIIDISPFSFYDQWAFKKYNSSIVLPELYLKLSTQ